jgi:hypothetical protein
MKPYLRRSLPIALAIFAAVWVEAAPEARLRLEAPMDRTLSPYTGFTRQHWLEITERLIAGVLPHLDPVTGMPRLPSLSGEKAYDAMVVRTDFQAFERIMMLSVIYASATGRDAVPGFEGSITEPFRRGIIEGLDPQGPHYWGPPAPKEHVGSIFCFGVLMCPKYFWDPFTSEQRQRLLAFLQLQGRNQAYDNNHHYFHLMPVPVLEANGWESNRIYHTQMLERLFGWYRGDGWFIDGRNGGFDKYNAWGFQLYNQAIYRFDASWRARFGERIKESARNYLQSTPYFYGELHGRWWNDEAGADWMSG